MKNYDNQVLQALLSEKSDEIVKLKTMVHQLQQQLAKANLFFSKTDHVDCFYCGHWFHVDEIAKSSCSCCSFYCCKNCIEERGISYTNCDQCRFQCCNNHLDVDNVCRCCK